MLRLQHNIIFPDDIKIISVNEQYSPRYGRNKRLVGFYRNPEVVKMMDHISHSLFVAKIPKNYINDNWGYLEVEYAAILKQSFNLRDLDNTIKHSFDAVFRYFGVNDSRVIDIHAHKYYNPHAANEAILLNITGLGNDPSLYMIDSAASV